MKILFLMSQIPYPLDTGAKIRTFNLISNLSRENSITLFTFGDAGQESQKITALREFCKKIELVHKTENNIFISALFNLFSGCPYAVDKYYSKEMSDKIAGLLEKESFDLIHCDSLQVSRNVLKLKNIPKILTEHNIESQILQRAAERESDILKKAYLYLQYLKLKKYEIFACKQFDRVITVSEEDKKFLSKFISEDKISVVPNGVDTGYFSPQSIVRSPQNEETLVFTGSMDWLPNRDAVTYFCKDILPLIWNVKKNLRFYIVGRNAPKSIVELGKNDARIVVTGSVDDVRPYMERTIVFVVPLRIGGGTRLKILEAFAMGKAVVSTSIGCEGLDVIDGENIAIVDKPIDFAYRVMELLNNEGLRNRLALNGRSLVEKKYRWDTVSGLLDKAWHDLVNKRAFPILLYHDICDDDFDINNADPARRPYILNKSEFEKQMKHLHDNGYKTIGLKEFYGDRFSYDHDKAVIIAFDDGLASNYKTALPILRRYGLKAVFFIIAGKVGQLDMMSWSQIRKLVDSGMEIGSHSLTHAVPIELSESALRQELEYSKRVLEGNLKIKIDYFSSPTGFYNPKLPELAKKAGYRAVLISRAALNRAGERFILNKTSVKRGCDLKRFISIVQRDGATFIELSSQQEMRNRLKRILGRSTYDTVRNLVLGRAR